MACNKPHIIISKISITETVDVKGIVIPNSDSVFDAIEYARKELSSVFMIAGRDFGDEVIAKCITLLDTDSAIRHAVIFAKNAGQKTATALAKALSSNHTIETLMIQFPSATTAQFLESMPKITSLRALTMVGRNQRDDILSAILKYKYEGDHRVDINFYRGSVPEDGEIMLNIVMSMHAANRKNKTSSH